MIKEGINIKEEPLKRSVIKEELVWLTGDAIKAVILNQFIYWSRRVYDFDKMVEEEQKRYQNEGKELEIEPCCGWIYKTAKLLSEETMLGLTPATIRKHLQCLIDNGYLLERTNPKFKWDHTRQYRVNFVKIYKLLQEQGYPLEGFKITDETPGTTEF